MSSNSSVALGTKLVLSIGEPWNFKSVDGDNIIHVRLAEILPDDAWLVESDSLVSVDALCGRKMLVRPRYVGESMLDPMCKGGINVNVALFDEASTRIADEGNRAGPHFVMVGTVRPPDASE